MEIGAFTFVDTARNPISGTTISAEQRLLDVIEEMELADQVGLDVFGIGEHHRPDFAASAPPIILAAAAVRTKRIRLTSAVTVLGSEDPIRVFQNFSTVDLLSGGRAEIMAGRGSFIESFPLFGYDLDHYDELFEEKLKLLLQVRDQEHVHWTGRFRAPLTGQGVYPRPVQNPLPVWLAVGGNPPSVVRAANLGLPLAVAIIGGEPIRFAPLVDLYREAAVEAGRDPATLRVSINSQTFIGDDSSQTADDFFPTYADVMSRIGRERGWPPLTRQQFDAGRSPRGALFVGSPNQIVDKILAQHEYFHHDRFLAQIGIGGLPHAKIMKAIELLGTVVAPAVRKALA